MYSCFPLFPWSILGFFLMISSPLTSAGPRQAHEDVDGAPAGKSHDVSLASQLRPEKCVSSKKKW